MTKTIRPEIITKSQAAALEAIRNLPEFANVCNILDAHATDPSGWGLEYSALNDMEYRQLCRVLKYGYSTAVEVKRITITRGEGPSQECGKQHIVGTWIEANKILKSMALTAPDMGYDKTDFSILFTNGDTYSGTYDLTHKDMIEGDLYKHVADHCEFYAGICKRLPSHIKPEQYQQIIQGSTLTYLMLLNDLIYPSAGKESISPELFQQAEPLILPEKNEYSGSLYDQLTLQVLPQNKQTYIIYHRSGRLNSFTSRERLNSWMQKKNLQIGNMIRENTYQIIGAYRIKMVEERSLYQHLPQIAIKMNGCMVRAYKEVTEDVTNIYVVMNYTEAFHFNYNTSRGLQYLRKFFHD